MSEVITHTKEEIAASERAVKFDEGKPRFDLIPVFPLFQLAELFAIGAKKYADRNWEKGTEWSRIYRALLSHTFKFWGGEDYDPVDGQHHLASVAWCALVLLEFTQTHPELDNRPKGGYKPVLPKTQTPSILSDLGGFFTVNAPPELIEALTNPMHRDVSVSFAVVPQGNNAADEYNPLSGDERIEEQVIRENLAD